MLRERDEMLKQAKEHLLKTQAAMKNSADKHRRDLQFSVGSSVFLKLRPYQQKTLAKTFCQKLSAKYYGPFTVLERIGAVAYRLQLPADCKIHPVFHVSQLKPVLGKDHTVTTLPVSFSENDEVILQPEKITSLRYDSEGHLEALIQWKGLPEHESSWLRVRDVHRDFPEFELEDKLSLIVGGGDVLISHGESIIVRRSMKRKVFKQERTSQLTWTIWSQINNGYGLLQAVTDVR
ncbi:uncharacterized protein LOC125582201 [Brassica napus]|uniref:uncharacterized protein LOC125582201 n=1 Tax=Brassica napus TaxID=3708 RepID=UPI002078F0BC|nr:uncharacterized protein LOC125582201 [Brassica napus]